MEIPITTETDQQQKYQIFLTCKNEPIYVYVVSELDQTLQNTNSSSSGTLSSSPHSFSNTNSDEAATDQLSPTDSDVHSRYLSPSSVSLPSLTGSPLSSHDQNPGLLQFPSGMDEYYLNAFQADEGITDVYLDHDLDMRDELKEEGVVW